MSRTTRGGFRPGRPGLAGLAAVVLALVALPGPAVVGEPASDARGDRAALRRSLAETLARDPENRVARLRLGGIHLAARDPAAAAREADRILAGAPKDREALLLAAKARGLTGEIEAAIRLYDRVLAQGAEKGKIADLALARKMLRDAGSDLSVLEAARRGILPIDMPFVIATREKQILTLLHRGPAWARTRSGRTEHFHIRTDAEKETIERLAGLFEGAWRILGTALPPSREGDARRTPVFAFTSRTDYVRFVAGLVGDGRFAAATTGAYVREARCIAILLSRRDARTLHVIFHEAMHEALDRTVGSVPRWLDEGLAEAVAARLVAPSMPEGARPRARMKSLRDHVAAKGMPRVGEIVRLDAEFIEPKSGPDAYALAWALADFLLARDASSGAGSVPRLLAALREGHPAARALKHAFGPEGIDALDAPFAAHVRRLLGTAEGRPR